MNKEQILLSKNFVIASAAYSPVGNYSDDFQVELGTVLSNLAWYGFVPSKELFTLISKYSSEELKSFWASTQETMIYFFKDVLEAKEGVVYKNFPEEVLQKSESEYWIAQILMYLGLPIDFFAEPEKEREAVSIDLSTLKVLKLADSDTLVNIFNSFKTKKVSLTPDEILMADCLVKELNITEIDISDFAFKMNGINIIGALETSVKVIANNMTDILRYAVILSGKKEIDLGQRIAFFKFSRANRKLLLSMMCNITHYEDDIAARRETFKALFKALRPGDYKWAKSVSIMYDELYNGKLRSLNGKVDVNKGNEVSFALLKSRPGVLVRRFHEMYTTNSEMAVASMKEVLKSLTVYQLLKFKKYVQNINDIKILMAKPNSSWDKAKMIENKKVVIQEKDINELELAIKDMLKIKLDEKLPEGIVYDEKLESVKLPSNDQELNIGRGTVIDIPENISFLRSATYWKTENSYNMFYDNSWNLLNENPTLDDSVCWNTSVITDVGVFSGDPVIQNNKNKVATQIIDINLNVAKEKGYVYALWNVLSFNNINFLKAEKAFGCLQLLEDCPQKGELFEPSKVDIQLDIKTNGLNKFFVLVDIQNRKLIYLDMPLPKMNTNSASNNRKALRELLPVILDQLKLIPSVKDLVECVSKGETPFLYTDAETPVKGKAYVFKEKNQESEIDLIDLQNLLK